MIHEDYEREHLKDAIFILETKAELEKEILKEEQLKPARIIIVKQKENDSKVNANVLPF